MKSRDLVEAHRLVFSAKLYDHQGPIARGGGRTNPPPPLTVRVMRNALTGRGLRGLQLQPLQEFPGGSRTSPLGHCGEIRLAFYHYIENKVIKAVRVYECT